MHRIKDPMPRLASGSPFSCVSILRLDKPTKTLGPSPVAWAICTITLGWGSLGLGQTPVLSCPFLAGAQVQCQSAREWRAPLSTPHGPFRVHGGGAEASRWLSRPCRGFCWPFHSVGKCPRVSVCGSHESEVPPAGPASSHGVSISQSFGTCLCLKRVFLTTCSVCSHQLNGRGTTGIIRNFQGKCWLCSNFTLCTGRIQHHVLCDVTSVTKDIQGVSRLLLAWEEDLCPCGLLEAREPQLPGQSEAAGLPVWSRSRAGQCGKAVERRGLASCWAYFVLCSLPIRRSGRENLPFQTGGIHLGSKFQESVKSSPAPALF